MAKKDEKAEEKIEEASIEVEAPEVTETAKEPTVEPVAEDISLPEIEDVTEVVEEPQETASTSQFSDYVEEIDASQPVTVQPVQFGSFDESAQIQGELNKNLEILMDIKLQLTVELGRAELPIKKVLELTRGSIIELEKVAGEPVELFANGKLVAHGEVVVIEDNFGLRITSITDPEDRLKGL